MWATIRHEKAGLTTRAEERGRVSRGRELGTDTRLRPRQVTTDDHGETVSRQTSRQRGAMRCHVMSRHGRSHVTSEKTRHRRDTTAEGISSPESPNQSHLTRQQ